MIKDGRSQASRIDQWKQEVHDQTLVGKKADSAVFGVSVAPAVSALAIECTTF